MPIHKKGIQTLCRYFLFQKVIFKARNKSNKNSVKDAPKNKKKKDSTSTVEKEISDQKPCDEETNTSVNERREEQQNNETDAEVQSEQNEDREEETVGAGTEKQEAVDGNAKDVKEEERGVKTEAEMSSCQDKASPTAQETGRQDEEVDKQEDSSANQD